MSDSDSLLQVGSQCSHPTCSEIDFLPIVCRCNKHYCRHHASPELHSCLVGGHNLVDLPFQKLQRCAVLDCQKPCLSACNECPHCQQSFCVDHRHRQSHSCPVQDLPLPEKSKMVRSLVAKNFPLSPSKKSSHQSQRTTKIPTDPVKLAQHHRMELFKLRHRASPGDSRDTSFTPLDQRLHLKLRIDNVTEKIFWFRKTIVAGKVLDCLAPHVGMKSSDTSPLQLLRVSRNTEVSTLRTDKSIADEVVEGDILVVQRMVSST